MSGRCPSLRHTLDRATTPVTFFFRDDDAGWADRQLVELCDQFNGRAPLDLAVIPLATTEHLAETLLAHPAPLRFHQHGYAHRNHQATGRKCELSDARSAESMASELRAGQGCLRILFGDRLDPIFTPPWNRCGAVAARLLVELGLPVLSRDRGAAPLDVPGLSELPIAVDWVRERADLDRALVDAIVARPAEAVGIMLHHEAFTDHDLSVVDALLDVLCAHPNARLASMADLSLTASHS